ncbi:MAG TPA: hypothetical protein VII82_07760 [Polyangiaceae bacterium]|jgi:hypothetical protein
MKTKRRVRPFAAAFLVALAVSACSSGPLAIGGGGVAGTCTLGGATYANGAAVPVPSPDCGASCACSNGSVVCDVPCDVALYLADGGPTQNAQGQATATQPASPTLDASLVFYEDAATSIGSQDAALTIDPVGNVTVFLDAAAPVIEDAMAPAIGVSPSGLCTYDGARYADGASFQSIDGCNACLCKDSLVYCTQETCANEAPPAH